MTIVSTCLRIVGSVGLRSNQSVILISMLGRILCSWIETEEGRVLSPSAEFDGMASNTLTTSS